MSEGDEGGSPKNTMKFTVMTCVSTDPSSPARQYNSLQQPEIGCEYEMTANGWIVGMNARVVVDEEGGWLWYPVPTSYSSYYFKEIPMRITVKTADVSEKLSKTFARWANLSRPKLLPREPIERYDIGIDRAIMGLRSAGF